MTAMRWGMPSSIRRVRTLAGRPIAKTRSDRLMNMATPDQRHIELELDR
jgi:hypothetical protein